jgi:hypothetical protein
MRFAVIPKDQQLTVRQAGDVVGYSATAVTRWIEIGTPLRNGSRLRLRAERYPAGWRTTQAWVREFIAALTAAHSSTPVAVNEDAARRADAFCAASGW